MQQYITQIFDIDKYLCKYFYVKDLLVIAQINKSVHKLIYDLTIVKQYLNFKIFEGQSLLTDFACVNNYVQLLDHIYNFNKVDELKYTLEGMRETTRRGHIQIFEWFSTNNIKIKYVDSFELHAIINNHQNIILWLKKYVQGYELTTYSVTKTYTYQKFILNIDVEYFNLQSFYFVEFLLISEYGLIEALNQINQNNNLRIRCEFDHHRIFFFNIAIKNGQIQILEWFRTNYNSILSTYALNNIQIAIKYNRYSIIKWFIDHKYQIDNLDHLIKMAQDKNRLDIISLLEIKKLF